MVAFMIIVVLGFPLAVMIGMLAMNKVERFVAGSTADSPRLHPTHGESAAPGGGTVDTVDTDSAAVATSSIAQPGHDDDN